MASVRINGLNPCPHTIMKGSLKELICWAPMKQPIVNVWQEEYGIEADLSNPQFDAREFNMRILFNDGMLDALYNFIDQNTVNYWWVPEYDCNYNVRIKSATVEQTGFYENFQAAVVNFSLVEDNPLSLFPDYVAPVGDSRTKEQEAYEDFSMEIWAAAVQGRPADLYVGSLMRYGCQIIAGTKVSTANPPVPHTPMIRSIDSVNGNIVGNADNNTPYGTTEVVISMLMRGDTNEELWINWRAMQVAMIQPGEHEFYDPDLGIFYGFYKNCVVDEYVPEHRWIKFRLTIVLTSVI